MRICFTSQGLLRWASEEDGPEPASSQYTCVSGGGGVSGGGVLLEGGVSGGLLEGVLLEKVLVGWCY